MLFLRIFFFFFLLTPCFASQQLIIEPDAGTKPLIDAIDHAKSSVRLVMYGLTEPSLIEAFVRAKNQGKDVKILLQRTPYKNENENNDAIKLLETNQVPLEFADGDFQLTHQKTLLLDDRDAIIMTFNLTRSTFSKERNFALVIDDPAIVREIQQVFSQDWKHDITPTHSSRLVWSPDNSREQIMALIQSARSTIQIYAQGLSDYQIIGELARAARRGVKVDILTSADESTKTRGKFAYLEKAGCTIRFSKHYVIHAKVIIIDKQKAMLGSINLTKPSINKNRELAIITNDSSVVNQLEQTFQKDF